MAATKTKRTLIASGTSNAAGATTSAAEWNLSAAYGGLLTVRVTNGATGPTVAASVVVYVGSASGEKRTLTTLAAPTTNGAVTDFAVDVPPAAMFVNLDVTGNTGQAVTCEAFGEELTGIS